MLLPRPTTVPLALALAAACLSSAQAYDPRLPLVGGEPSPAQKLARFEASVRDTPLVRDALATAAAEGVAPRDQIHTALLALPDYAVVYGEFEHTGINASAWRDLLERLPEGDAFARAHATFLLGRSLLQLEDLSGAAAAFEAVRGRLRLACPWTDEATLYLAQIYGCMAGSSARVEAANHSRARRLVATLLDPTSQRFAWAPERVREGALWLDRELSGEGSGPLLALARKMAVIERLIRQSRTGDPTQERQDEVVAQLDRLIELLREKESGGS